MFQYSLRELRGFTPATIRAAFNKSAEIINESGDLGSANVSSILTHIIHAANYGANRRHASDIVYGLDKIRSLAENKKLVLSSDDEPFDEIITFGVREDGVDHNSYIMSTLLQSRHNTTGYVFPKHTYRQILAVRMRVWIDGDRHCIRVDFSLRDITNSIHSIDPVDMMPDTYAIRNMPFEDLKNPEPTEERNRIDDEEIKALKEKGYQYYAMRGIPQDILAAELCEGVIKCAELFGAYDSRVPDTQCANTSPYGKNAIARLYVTPEHTFIVSWIQPEYKYFSEVTDLLASAKSAFRNAFDPNPDQDPGPECNGNA